MDRDGLLAQLQAAKRKVAASDGLIAEQRQIVVSLRLAGSDTSLAEETLSALQVGQEAHLAEIERILDELDRIPILE